MASDAQGNFIVVWHSNVQDAGTTGVFGQRYSASGVRKGAEFQVNTYTTAGQYRASVASDPAGNFVVVWQSYQDGGSSFYGFVGVFGQRFDDKGRRRGSEFQVNSYTTGYQGGASVASDASGNFVVAWGSGIYLDPAGQDGSFRGMFGQRFNSLAKPRGSEFQINTYTTDNQYGFRSVTSDAYGNFVVVWHSYLYPNPTGPGQDGSYAGIFGQRFAANGNRRGAEFQVNTFTPYGQYTPSIGSGVNGNFVVVWQSPQGGGGNNIFGQRYDPSGNPLGGEFQVNTYTPGQQSQPSVASDANGDFVVVWVSGGQDGDGGGIFGQRYDAAGNPVGTELQVNTYTTGNQQQPSVASDPLGNFAVVWRSGPPVLPCPPPPSGQDGDCGGIFGQRFASFRLPVRIDVDPDSSHNEIELGDDGFVSVAILTTRTFDAATVDRSTLRFGATGTEASPVRSALKDVDDDHDKDLVLRFRTGATKIQCGFAVAFLTGKTTSGQPFEGQDRIDTEGCR